jgi:hypothetical protein
VCGIWREAQGGATYRSHLNCPLRACAHRVGNTAVRQKHLHSISYEVGAFVIKSLAPGTILVVVRAMQCKITTLLMRPSIQMRGNSACSQSLFRLSS